MLNKGKRQQFHRLIGAVLETRFPEVVEPRRELLAHHSTEAGPTDQAISYWLKAVQRSRARSALCEASSHFAKGARARRYAR